MLNLIKYLFPSRRQLPVNTGVMSDSDWTECKRKMLERQQWRSEQRSMPKSTNRLFQCSPCPSEPVNAPENIQRDYHWSLKRLNPDPLGLTSEHLFTKMVEKFPSSTPQGFLSLIPDTPKPDNIYYIHPKNKEIYDHLIRSGVADKDIEMTLLVQVDKGYMVDKKEIDRLSYGGYQPMFKIKEYEPGEMLHEMLINDIKNPSYFGSRA